MAITYLSGQRIQGSTTITTNTQATGSTSDYSVYYNTSTHQRRFLGERFNTGHALVGKTITEVQFDLLKSGSPNDVYDLVVLSTSDAVTTLESVDLSLVGTSFATYTFDDFTSFTLGAGERIGIYANAQSGGGSTPYVRVAHTGSDVIANANMYQIHDEGNVDVTGDLKYTIKYSASDKDLVTDVPVGSQFEETNTRKFYQRGISSITFTSSGNSDGSAFGFGASGYESCGVKLTNDLTPDFTGSTAVSITLAIKADSGGASTGTYKGFVQTASGSTTFTALKSFSYGASSGSYVNTEFDLPSEEIEDDGIVGVTITAFSGGLDCEAWDTTNQSGDYIPQRGNSSASMGDIRDGMTVTIVSSATPSWIERGTAI